ncbi:MAG: hypothetical protein ABFD79_12830 [Phycisphaerales bacterium]
MKNGLFIFVMLLFIVGCENIPTPKGSSTSSSNVEESKKRGNRITSALAAYRADHLAFPANLSLLVPKYIPKIEPPLSGGKWTYQTFEKGQRYNLNFGKCLFDSQQNYWNCDGK